MILRIYTAADLAQLKAWLLEAYAHRRVVATGGRVQSVSHEGNSVSYSSANAGELDAWIQDLTDTIAWLEGRSYGRRPILGAF